MCDTKTQPAALYHQEFRFDNDYGASVICNLNVMGQLNSYGSECGRFELAVLDFSGDSRGKITYDTPITGDVLGYLSFADVAETLERIRQLTR
jgi:hypothetical protein